MNLPSLYSIVFVQDYVANKAKELGSISLVLDEDFQNTYMSYSTKEDFNLLQRISLSRSASYDKKLLDFFKRSAKNNPAYADKLYDIDVVDDVVYVTILPNFEHVFVGREKSALRKEFVFDLLGKVLKHPKLKIKQDMELMTLLFREFIHDVMALRNTYII